MRKDKVLAKASSVWIGRPSSAELSGFAICTIDIYFASFIRQPYAQPLGYFASFYKQNKLTIEVLVFVSIVHSILFVQQQTPVKGPLWWHSPPIYEVAWGRSDENRSLQFFDPVADCAGRFGICFT